MEAPHSRKKNDFWKAEKVRFSGLSIHVCAENVPFSNSYVSWPAGVLACSVYALPGHFILFLQLLVTANDTIENVYTMHNEFAKAYHDEIHPRMPVPRLII